MACNQRLMNPGDKSAEQEEGKRRRQTVMLKAVSFPPTHGAPKAAA